MDRSDLELEARIKDIKTKMASAASAAGRDQGAVALIAVSKTQPDEKIEAALQAGLRVFGENRVQEAVGRWAHRRAHFPDLTLHLIGPLQTNKISEACSLFDVIETLDREKLAEGLSAYKRKAGRLPRLLVQVNTGEEPQKAGVSPAALPAFLELCRQTHDLHIEGLMCIPPVDEEPAMHFALLAKLAHRHGLSQLSMGMSDDFECAVRLGATHVRVGSALFGARGG
jgi:PLP dependent protein